MNCSRMFCNIIFVFKSVYYVEGVANVAAKKLDALSVFDVRNPGPPVIDKTHDPSKHHVTLLTRWQWRHAVHFGSVNF